MQATSRQCLMTRSNRHLSEAWCVHVSTAASACQVAHSAVCTPELLSMHIVVTSSPLARSTSPAAFASGEGELKQLLMGKGVSLSSQFRLTYSMILNLLRVEDLKVSSGVVIGSVNAVDLGNITPVGSLDFVTFQCAGSGHSFATKRELLMQHAVCLCL